MKKEEEVEEEKIDEPHSYSDSFPENGARV